MRAVALLNPPDLSQYWLQITQAWEDFPALNDFYDLSDIPQMVHTPGVYQLWLACENDKVAGVMITILLHYPKRKVLHISVIAGEGLRRFLDIGLANLDHYALLMGASTIAFDGRKGLSKLLAKRGYKESLRMERNVARARGN